MQISTASTPVMQVHITTKAELGAPFDPTGDTVEMCFLPDGVAPVLSTTWFPASWQTDTMTSRYYAQCQIGLNTSVGVLSVGTWRPWVRITDTPELIILPARTAFSVV